MLTTLVHTGLLAKRWPKLLSGFDIDNWGEGPSLKHRFQRPCLGTRSLLPSQPSLRLNLNGLPGKDTSLGWSEQRERRPRKQDHLKILSAVSAAQRYAV